MSGRLARGRSYARAGQVLDFELAQGKVTAQVQGSRARPYQVRIGVLPLTTAQWRRVEAALASQALFRAKLLAGEMPHEIEEVFAELRHAAVPPAGRRPGHAVQLPGLGVPCKHLAAVCYVLAEEFDRDPFAMLAWRGQGRDELLAALRQVGARAAARLGTRRRPVARRRPRLPRCRSPRRPRRPVAGVGGGPGSAAGGVPGRVLVARAEPGRLRALAASPGSGAPDLLLRMFPPPPVKVRGKDLADVLAPAYAGSPRRIRVSKDLAGLAQLARGAAGGRPDTAHGLGQAPPAQRGQPVVGVDGAQDLP